MSTNATSQTIDAVHILPTPFRVLVVDDMPENLALLTEVFSTQGFTTLGSESGAEALQLLGQNDIHLIVADAMMPSMDGFQLCREVKQNPAYASIPYIIYTGHYVDVEDQLFAKSIGVDAYVMKFDGLSTLMETVNDLCQSRYGTPFSNSDVDKPNTSAAPTVDAREFLERHHAVIVRKLEEKMQELEMYAETLAQKNREIQFSESRYRNLFERAGIGIFILDKEDGKVLDVNAEGLSLLGYTKEELAAIEPLSFVQDSATAKAILQSGAFLSKETVFKRRDGHTVDVDLGAGPFSEQIDKRIMVYVLDITEQKKMRQQLIQSEKMAFMGRLAASIAHDIRNPLAAITLNLQYLAKRLPADFPDRGALNFAIEGSQRIGKIIENTLNLARITPPVVKPEQINNIVSQALMFLKSSISQRNISVETNLASDLPLIDIEAKQIEQVILNIIQNAIDCSPEKSTIQISTCLIENLNSHSESSHNVAVVILDRGPGLSPEQMKRLFEPFETTKRGGTGLGLALSKQIMDKHRAEIRIEPAVGGGTIARLIFPVTLTKNGDN